MHNYFSLVTHYYSKLNISDTAYNKYVSASAYIRQGIDSTFALAAIITLSPVMALAGIAAYLSTGNVLYWDKRAGQNTSEVWVPKFQTLKPGTAPAENRRTRTGNVLRAINADELPQLVLVFRGTFTLIGPRPQRKEDFSKVDAALFQKRQTLKPGICGSRSHLFVKEGHNLSMQERLEIDLDYHARNNIVKDIALMCRILFTSIVGRNGDRQNDADDASRLKMANHEKSKLAGIASLVP